MEHFSLLVSIPAQKGNVNKNHTGTTFRSKQAIHFHFFHLTNHNKAIKKFDILYSTTKNLHHSSKLIPCDKKKQRHLEVRVEQPLEEASVGVAVHRSQCPAPGTVLTPGQSKISLEKARHKNKQRSPKL